MKARLLAISLALISLGCSSDVYSASDILVAGISQQADVEYVYFRVADGSNCTGVRIRSDGTKRTLSFVRSSPDVDSAAEVSEDYPWEGMLRVEIPIGRAVLEHGGELTLVIEGGGELRELGTFGYLPAAGPK